MKFCRTSWTAGVIFAALALGLVPVGLRAGLNLAHAQNLGQRVVSGAVVDAKDVPIVGATVFIKDLKTKSIRSYTTVEHGRFRFGQVTMTTDQELWAEKDGKKTATKTVSSWDTRKEFEIELRLK